MTATTNTPLQRNITESRHKLSCIISRILPKITRYRHVKIQENVNILKAVNRDDSNVRISRQGF